MTREQAQGWMDLALSLAARGKGTTRPNPMVGAVVVKDGRVIGEGYHVKAGEPHAEVHALRAAGEGARGADLIVTLEPCCHVGRTPACTDGVIKAGIARVWVGALDPNPLVSGQGITALRDAGIEVITGIRTPACEALNKGYNHWMATGRPHITLKLATSLDGKIATSTGASQWITGPPARRAVHALRSEVDAVTVGSGTARADDPSLTVRDVPYEGPQPARILIDSRLSVPPTAKLFARDGAQILLVTSDDNDAAALSARHAMAVELPTPQGQVCLAQAMETLGTLPTTPIRSVLVEGGSGLATALLKANLVDELRVFLAPIYIGGDGLGALSTLGVSHPDEAPRFTIERTLQHGEDIEVRMTRKEASCSQV